jgi:hypothetical protein
VNVRLVVMPNAVAPPGNSQKYWVGPPVEELASKLTAWFTWGLAGEKVKLAVRPPVPVPGLVMLTDLEPLVQPEAVATTFFVPALDQVIETEDVPLPVMAAPAPAVQFQVPGVQLAVVAVKLYAVLTWPLLGPFTVTDGLLLLPPPPPVPPPGRMLMAL